MKIDHTERETTGVVGKAERLTWHKAWTMVSTGFSISYTWTAYYFLSLFKYFVQYFFPLDREDLLKLMDLAKDSPDAKQELLERLLSGKRMTGRDEMDIKRILKTKEALDNIRNFIDKQQLTNSDTPKKSTVPNEDKKGIR
ncbi:hypothetical protein [Escherichia coli]|uniref:hypothetical protein n=1 Tax=Escherichia coli TaxID=562 RepID=UPI003EBF830F